MLAILGIFLDGVEYDYNSAFIRVQDSLAQLRPVDERIVGITDLPIDTYEFDNSNGLNTDIIKVSDNIYAIDLSWTLIMMALLGLWR